MTTDTHNDIAELLAELTDDGDTVELADGRTLRLRLSPDDLQFSDVETADGLGTVAWVERDRNRGYGDAPRPRGFTGNAEKLTIGRGDRVWWEPSPNGPKRGTPEFTAERTIVRDILEFGYTIMTLELCDGTDAYGRPIVVGVASLGGIEPFADRDYVRSIVSDLACELEIVA